MVTVDSCIVSGMRAVPNNESRWRSEPKGRKCRNFFQYLKNQELEVQCERTFDWLFHPRSSERLLAETAVFEALVDHCARTRNQDARKACCDPQTLLSDAAMNGRRRRLEFDFFLPEVGIAIEFDERQHFTAERAITFQHYGDTVCHFDVSRWQAMCSSAVRDPDPPCRDWERAFRDAVRDIRAARGGVALYRVYYKDEPSEAIAKIIEKLRRV